MTSKAFPLSDYTAKSAPPVFKLQASPRSSPVDLNFGALAGDSQWNMSDRVRFWHTLAGSSPLPIVRLTIRKLDFDENALAHCHLEADGTLIILSNSKEYALRIFRTLFVNTPPSFAGIRNWKTKSGWAKQKKTTAFFAG